MQKFIVALLVVLLGVPALAQETKSVDKVIKGPVKITVTVPAKVATKKAVTTKKAVDAPKAEEVKTAKPEEKVEVKTADAKAETKVEVKAEELTWWKMLLKHLMELVFLILGIMATAFVTVLMKKYGFEAHTAKVNDVLNKSVGWAEQTSLKAAKLTGNPNDGAKKMEAAVDFAITMAKEYKLPNKGKDWWEGKLESWLGVAKK